jgi:hypothetical protein
LAKLSTTHIRGPYTKLLANLKGWVVD